MLIPPITPDDGPPDEPKALTIARTLLAGGMTPDETDANLRGRGVSREVSRRVIREALRTAGVDISDSTPNRELGRRNMIQGGLWTGGGLLVTIVSLVAASPGGTYVLAWGAIIYGLIQFFRGTAQAWPDASGSDAEVLRNPPPPSNVSAPIPPNHVSKASAPSDRDTDVPASDVERVSGQWIRILIFATIGLAALALIVGILKDGLK